MAEAAVAIGAIGAITQGFGAMKEGQANANAAQYNAQVAEQNAALSRQQAAEEERRFRIQSRKQLGDIRANYGASGITLEGSPLDVLQESAANAELDALQIRHQGSTKSKLYKQEAAFQRKRAASASEAGLFGFASSLLSGGANVAGKL